MASKSGELMSETVAYICLLLLGALVFIVGKLTVGENRNGGKRVVICLVDFFLLALGGLLVVASIKAGDWNEMFTYCICIGGTISLAAGMRLVASGIFAKNGTIERIFGSVLGGI